MAPKKANEKECAKQKRKKDVIDLGQKLKILDLLRQGEKVAALANWFNVNESTMRTIRATDEEKIRKIFSNLGNNAKYSKISRGGMIWYYAICEYIIHEINWLDI